MKFQIGNNKGGRTLGAKGKLNKEHVYNLVNMTVSDLNTNFDKLTTNQKIRILHTFKSIIQDDLEMTWGISSVSIVAAFAGSAFQSRIVLGMNAYI